MPRSLLHLPLGPFPLYSLIISPCCHCGGICLVFVMWLKVLRYIVLVFPLASMNAELGMSSGPVALFLFSLAIAFSSSLRVNGAK